MIGTTDDINAVNEQQKQYLNMLYPQIVADPETPVVSKAIFKRLVHKVNWVQSNIINGIVPYSASERQAKEYIDDLNLWYMPKTIFNNPNADFFTYRLYIQKADDSEEKDKVLKVLNKMMMDQGLTGKWEQMTSNPMANSASNIMMAQNAKPQEQIMSRPWGNENLATNSMM